MIQTDLSAAFDTVDHEILLDKLDHYGVRDKEYNKIKSFLSNRQQYVFIDGMESELIYSGESSVCQGSKLSSLLYILYTNEIPLLDKMTNNDFFTRLTNKDKMTDLNDIDNYTVQYVDDSTTMMSTNDTKDIKKYIDNYFNILEHFYTINKLTLNQDKTKFMVIVKPSKRHMTNELVLNTTDFIIRQVDKVKILGIYFTAGLSHTATVNSVISRVNFRLKILRNVFRYTSKRTSLMIMNACILSIFKYACPVLIDSNINLQHKMNTLLIKCTHMILGFRSYKWNLLQS